MVEIVCHFFLTASSISKDIYKNYDSRIKGKKQKDIVKDKNYEFSNKIKSKSKDNLKKSKEKEKKELNGYNMFKVDNRPKILEKNH